MIIPTDVLEQFGELLLSTTDEHDAIVYIGCLFIEYVKQTQFYFQIIITLVVLGITVFLFKYAYKFFNMFF